ncbi:hypothetical protein [Variovorax guangxiensis]|uniref:Uncharacterized protein n=1 Tax=Variovorax guangxiensis TaxID=1775474 RepID=A0A840G3T6_9BURK|nr:hypothetical protein [Variovorax guangxiensis]MBB4223941.1 hypothetical protein [Variovorax guangxiensis]
MPAVRLEGYIELAGYFVALCAAQGRHGWCSWAQFMPDLEFGDGCTKIPVFRHRVPGLFATKEDSLDAAFEYAYRVVEDDAIEG